MPEFSEGLFPFVMRSCLDTSSSRRNKKLRIVLDSTNTKSTWRAQAQPSRALYHVGIANTFFIGLCPPIGTGCTWETMHGDIPATCGAPSISSLNVLIQLCRRHARLYLKKTMLSRLPHCLMVGHQSPVQNRLVHRGTNFRGGID